MLKGKCSKYLIFVVLSTSFTSWKPSIAGSNGVEEMKKGKGKVKMFIGTENKKRKKTKKRGKALKRKQRK